MPEPQFFDIFGIFAFLYIVVVSLWALKSKKELPLWALAIMLFIGVLGLAIDSVVVYSHYLK